MSTRSILPATWEVPQRFHDRLGDEVGRQRLMAQDGHLLLVLHAPPGADDDEREGRFFWRQPDGTWKTSVAGSGIGAMEQHLHEYDELLDTLEDHEEKAEHAGDYFEVLRAMTPLQRAARNLHSVLQKAREAMNDDPRIINWRDEAYHLERRAELLLGETRYGLDFIGARNAEAQAVESHQIAASGHRLNVLAALFLPTATIASLMGMNVPHGLETAAAPWAFFGFLALGIVTGLVVKTMLDAPA